MADDGDFEDEEEELPFEGVVAHVAGTSFSCSAKALKLKITNHGGTVASRWTKKVTHLIYSEGGRGTEAKLDKAIDAGISAVTEGTEPILAPVLGDGGCPTGWFLVLCTCTGDGWAYAPPPPFFLLVLTPVDNGQHTRFPEWVDESILKGTAVSERKYEVDRAESMDAAPTAKKTKKKAAPKKKKTPAKKAKKAGKVFDGETFCITG